MKIHSAYISVGSNMGNKCMNCQQGISALISSGTETLKNHSPFYITEPVGFKDQDWFVNTVINIETSLTPFQLLDRLKSIEQDAGRTNDSIKFGPRILDLDILIYDDRILNSPRLVLPHPRMHKRRFVLKPFCDIDPQKVHPVLKKNMQYLLRCLNDNEQKITPCRCD
jgi:2-amino-4-hydroxy-6-hydroxymethyldihydropteridine diphosphokinase